MLASEITMGVLPCDRAGCETIMCDRLSDDYGYICDPCFAELELSGTLDILEFMETPKKLDHRPGESFYEEIFPEMEF
jgi:hypothetical protein